MSSYTFSKQIGNEPRSRGHRELTVADYRLLPQVFANPEKVVRDRPDKPTELALSSVVAGRRWRAAFKVLADKGNFGC